MPVLRILFACFLASALGTVGLVGAAGGAVSYKITGTAWVDANGNKIRSVWEKPLPGATVRLLHPVTKAVIRTATTRATGSYSLADVRPGTYRITLTVPAGYTGTFNSPIVIAAGDVVKNFVVGKERSVEERALNAFGDSWSLAKPNGSLLRAGAAGCYRRPAAGTGPSFTAEELQFLKALSARFYLEGCAVVLETNPPFDNEIDFQTSDLLKARVAQFKAALPSRQYLGYQRVVGWEVGQVGWTDIYDNHKDWFVYKKGSTGQDEADIVQNSNNARLLDLTNPAYQDYIVARLARALTYYKLDGLVFDNVAPLPRLKDPSTLPDSKKAAWEKSWLRFLTRFKAAVGPKKFVFASIPRDNLAFAKKIIPIVDGIMLEDTFSPVRNGVAARMRSQKPIIDVAAAAGKWIMTTQNTKVDGSTFTNTNPAKEHVYERYYLAAFYIFNKGKMLFYYNPPSATTPQYASQAFFTDWNIKVGTPKGPYTEIEGRSGVYKRNYANAIVYLNSSNSKYVVSVPRGSQFKFDPDGKAIKGYVLQPKSGFILSNQQAFR